MFPARVLEWGKIPLVDSHIHTLWTDGKDTVMTMHQASVDLGLTSILFSEHSRENSINWFPSFAREVRSLPNEFCHAFVGTEVKVKSLSGDVDTCSEITELCEFVIGSVHRFVDKNKITIPSSEISPGEALEIEYRMTMAVLDNPVVDILGHIFGMSITRKQIIPREEMLFQCISKAAKKGVAIEINSKYHPNPNVIIEICKENNANFLRLRCSL